MEIHGTNSIDAWKQAATLILEKGEQHNLSVTVNKPLALPRNAFTALSPNSVVATADDVLEVANTIFPVLLSQRAANRDELYGRYLAIMKRLRDRRGGFGTWGTYFERLIYFGATRVNQLDRVIQKLNAWPIASKTGLVFHTSSPETDSPRTRGGPCWHYGELLCHKDGTIDLFAVYRNQDYFNKALGNFVGLANLLDFICQQTGREPGKLICNAAHAFNGGRKSDLSTLVLR